MASNYNVTDTVTGEGYPITRYGSFKVGLANLLFMGVIIELATFFEYPIARIEELGNAGAAACLLMVRLMEMRGQIQPNDISPLLHALHRLDKLGIEKSVRDLFKSHTGIHYTEGYSETPINDLNIKQRHCKSAVQRTHFPKDLYPRQFPRADHKRRVGCDNHPVGPKYWQTTNGTQKTRGVVEALRKTYSRWYSKIQPIPYIRDRMFGVNEIYVENGIEIVEGGAHIPSKLDSFRDVFDKGIISSRNILLEGDPGYGKSTFALQAAYDWCAQKSSPSSFSPLRNFQVLILLPLRLLGSISSIYEAIRSILLPTDLELSEKDVKEILKYCKTVLFVFDGYDEYPDRNCDTVTDVHRIIEGDMFADFKVLTSTRSSSLLRNLYHRYVTVRLTGFNDVARNRYITKSVVPNDDAAATRIIGLLKENPILSDICQVPMFCVLFAHMAEKEDDRIELNSVTSFIKHIISCMYNHMWVKDRVPSSNRIVHDYVKLMKIAFEGLCSESQQSLQWSATMFKEAIGISCYNDLVKLGILIEEEKTVINYEPGIDVANFINDLQIVRFYHKLFAEWYAANHLSAVAGRFLKYPWLKSKFKQIHPFDLQFVFRFACGLNSRAAKRIIRYLQTVEGGQKFASLCFFEQAHEPGESFNTLRNGNIVLCSGLELPPRLMVTKINLKDDLRNNNTATDLPEDSVRQILTQGLRSAIFEELMIDGYLLPMTLSPESIPDGMRSKKFPVSWRPHDQLFNLNPQSGHWEMDDMKSLKRLCKFAFTINGSESTLKQRSTIQMLQIASRMGMPIALLELKQSFFNIEAGLMVLQSGFGFLVHQLLRTFGSKGVEKT
ncbi:hypothetical protein BSL78_23702 [Apostichopus japonicus]|uniref:NACHT domain-containing protein n=1 Tax=Stichopus japonicus TaxID=307972 RepID=A0A2G8JUM5_STIJA|nr:hypothetical protein BSL78_23702 [Apostichopus japonicus]